MKTKLPLHVRKYRISLKSLSSDLERRAGVFFLFFPFRELFHIFVKGVNENGEVKLFFMIGKITTLTLTLTTKGCLSKISKTADGFMLKRKLDPFLMNAI